MMENNNILNIMHLGEDNHLITFIGRRQPNKKNNDDDSLFNSMRPEAQI